MYYIVQLGVDNLQYKMFAQTNLSIPVLSFVHKMNYDIRDYYFIIYCSSL